MEIANDQLYCLSCKYLAKQGEFWKWNRNGSYTILCPKCKREENVVDSEYLQNHSQHTPGPWKAHGLQIGSDRGRICEVPDSATHDIGVSRANGHYFRNL